MTNDYEAGRRRKEAAMAWFEVLARLFRGGTQAKDKKFWIICLCTFIPRCRLRKCNRWQRLTFLWN